MKALREFTPARVALARAGNALATREVLAFQAACAAARDAVHHPLDTASIVQDCAVRGWPAHVVRSAAATRDVYLRRPDLGRRLDAPMDAAGPYDVALVIADGLSALAVHRHAMPVLDRLVPRFDAAGWSRSAVVLVEQGRVAIGDEIGEALRAESVLVLIGERPGLSSPDSLGAYLTWHPRLGRTDAERNCLSNIRPEGLGYDEASERLFALMTEARRRQLTGVSLKEDRPQSVDPSAVPFLLKN